MTRKKKRSRLRRNFVSRCLGGGCVGGRLDFKFGRDFVLFFRGREVACGICRY